MNRENGKAFLALSPSDVDVQDPDKRSKISYTRDFLLSLDKSDSTVKLPMEAQLSMSCVVDDASGLLSPPICVPDSGCQKSEPEKFLLKVPDDVNQLLHRSNEPYRPPCRYKALPSPNRDRNEFLKGDISGSSECINQQRAEGERWKKDMISQFCSAYEFTNKDIPDLHEGKSYADTISAAREDKWHSSKNTDFKDSPEEFLMSPATRNSNTSQFTSTVISKQLDASRKSSQVEGAVRDDAGLSSTLLESTKSCSTQRQQDLTSNGTVNPWLKTVNHIDTSWHLISMLDNGMLFMESEEYSDFNLGHPEGSVHVMESLKKSRAPSFLSQENCGNHKNHCEVAYEQGLTELQLSNASVCVHDSARRIAISDSSDAFISPPSVEKEKQVISAVDDCKSTMVYCKGISVNMKQNPSSPDLQIQQEMELNSFSSSVDGESNSSSELCLPDEDSLITFDEPFLMPDVENLTVVDSSMSNSPERNPIKTDLFNPSSPRAMIEKLVEFILNDESSPTPRMDDPIVHHGAELRGSFHSMHAQQPHTQFCSNQLNPGRDQQNHNFQRNSVDSAIYSYFSHPFPFNTFSQPFPLYHDELRRLDHEVSQSSFQHTINPGKLHLCSLCVSQSGVPPHLPALQMASCTQKLNLMQNCCTLGYQDPNYGDFVRHYPGFHGDSSINQAAVDSFIDMKLQASHWHPHVPGFQ